jgi:hypothetical protein
LEKLEQMSFIEEGNKWDDYWVGMPEYDIEDQAPKQQIVVNIRDEADRAALSKALKQTLTTQTKSVWYPPANIVKMVDKAYITKKEVALKYPIYIPSKGRHETRLTVRSLDKIGVPYRIVVEPQEHALYAAVIPHNKIITLPFSNQGLHITRTWILDHSKKEGHERHWQLDDNIDGFFRFNKNIKIPVSTGATFRAIEDFVDRYENIDLAGMNYFMFVKRKYVVPPIVWNTRIYSCTLVNNNQPERWESYFNDDTDISLRVLLRGRCTALFNAFLCGKSTTMTVKGGLTDDYQGDGRLKMAQALKDRHPHFTKITRKFGRWQHHVDYSPFKKNKPLLKNNLSVRNKIDDYGMVLICKDSDFNNNYLAAD